MGSPLTRQEYDRHIRVSRCGTTIFLSTHISPKFSFWTTSYTCTQTGRLTVVADQTLIPAVVILVRLGDAPVHLLACSLQANLPTCFENPSSLSLKVVLITYACADCSLGGSSNTSSSAAAASETQTAGTNTTVMACYVQLKVSTPHHHISSLGDSFHDEIHAAMQGVPSSTSRNPRPA